MTLEGMSVKSFWISEAKNTPQIWSMSAHDRLVKQMHKLGLSQHMTDQTPKEAVLMLRGDVVYDTVVLKGMLEHANSVLKADEILGASIDAEYFSALKDTIENSKAPPAGLKTITPEQAGGNYNKALRKSEPPICRVLNEKNKDQIEWDLFKGSYKGVTDLVTKYAWPVPAFHITRLCAKWELTPNMVTSIGAILMFAALWAFGEGEYGWGLLAGWIMTFLDTVDGKLARTTITSSKWGNIFDHGIDLIHPPFWYIAWGMGLAAYGTTLPDGWLVPTLYAMFGFYVAGRLVEGYFMRRFGMHLHIWRPFDSYFRLVLARRNPNMIILSLSWIFGRPDIGLLMITAWSGITFLVHIIQTIQAEIAKARGKPVQSWLEQIS